jgi:hypothetical protein
VALILLAIYPLQPSELPIAGYAAAIEPQADRHRFYQDILKHARGGVEKVVITHLALPAVFQHPRSADAGAPERF